jgi:large subunit ribosomal protein L17
MEAILYQVSDFENPKKKRSKKKVDLVAKLFDEYAPKYKDRKGGYTRIIKIGQRKGDQAMEVLFELV